MLNPSDLPAVSAGPDKGDTAWKSRACWQAANSAVYFLLSSGRSACTECALERAEALKAAYESLYPLLDELCRALCPRCSDPCCRRADPRFDLTDLVFIHLIKAPIPLGQPRGEGRSVCRYLGPCGCLLSRLSRPWICTWYLCPAQKRLLEENDPCGFVRFKETVSEIKKRRRQVEDCFIFNGAGRSGR